MTTILSILVAVLITFFLTFFLCRIIPREKVKQFNQELTQREQELQLQIKDKEQEYNNLTKQFELTRSSQEATLREDLRSFEQKKTDVNISFLKAEMQLKENIASLESSIEEKKKSIQDLDKEQATALKALEQRTYDLMVNELESNGQLMIDQQTNMIVQARQEYEIILQDLATTYQERTAALDLSYSSLLEQIKEAKAKAAAITESNKRAQLEREKKDFYRLQLSDIDIEEIQKIRSIEPYLRQKEPLNKVIWKVYYEKPYNDLIGRVVGTGTKCGVYKITHIDSGKCYVGQSNNISERFRQHIKRGIGADPPTQSKLYPAMLEYGAENFIFEILEECPPQQLTEREKYYTTIFDAQSFGFVSRKG